MSTCIFTLNVCSVIKNLIISFHLQGLVTDDTVFLPEDFSRLSILCDTKEKCNLHINPTSVRDNGEYHCLYKAK